jgi:hypothetical protein
MAETKSIKFEGTDFNLEVWGDLSQEDFLQKASDLNIYSQIEDAAKREQLIAGAFKAINGSKSAPTKA